MFSKLICFIACTSAIVMGQHAPAAAQFPAGVNPALCPNFPICDNAYLHNPNQQQQQQQWNAPAPQQQQWNAPAQNQWNQPQQQQQWNAPAQQQQWNQPQPQQWNQPQSQWDAPAINGPTSNHLTAGGDKYPAGVDPNSCPNYPYCDTNGVTGHSAPQVAPLPGYTERLYPAGVSAQQCPNFPYCN